MTDWPSVIVYQANTTSSQRGEEKIKERCQQMTDALRRRETALLAELRRAASDRQSAIDAELERIRYNITRYVTAGQQHLPDRSLTDKTTI